MLLSQMDVYPLEELGANFWLSSVQILIWVSAKWKILVMTAKFCRGWWFRGQILRSLSQDCHCTSVSEGGGIKPDIILRRKSDTYSFFPVVSACSWHHISRVWLTTLSLTCHMSPSGLSLPHSYPTCPADIILLNLSAKKFHFQTNLPPFPP